MISAMQGMLESGGKLGVLAELLPEEVAKRSVKFADAMFTEYGKTFGFSEEYINKVIKDHRNLF
jgi:hypothetical protein